MIHPIQSFSHALAIMNMLMGDEELQHHPEACYIEAYQNGREQGITIFGFDGQIAYFVADHRNGDTPRIHKGQYSMQSVSEDAYKHQHNFNSVDEAYQWLRGDILEELAAEQEKRHES